jgi:uncharacterized protein YcbX
VKRTLDGTKYDLDFYGSTISVVDQGEESAKWFSEILGLDCRFAAILPGPNRRTRNGEIIENCIFYGTPILMMSSESCEALSAAIGMRIGNDRFRSNIVISGFDKPFQEDMISAVLTEDWCLDGVELCIKCTYPGINQQTGILDSRTVGLLRESRQVSKVEMHPIYRKASSQWEANDYVVGVYMQPRVASDSGVRIFVGQEIECKY